MSGRKKKSRFPLFVAVAAAFFIAGFMTAWLVSKGHTPSPVPPKKTAKKSEGVLPAPLAGAPRLEPQTVKRHRLAIVIDDIGLRKEPVQKLMALDIPFTFAVMPGQPHTKDLAETIHAAGFELMIHLPMEPEDYQGHNPGGEALLVSQSDEEIRDAVRRVMAEIPAAAGVNNHMGSLFTQNPRKMRVVLGEMKSAGLFFVDSLTTPKSVALPLAREMGVKSAARRVFLDNEEDTAEVEKMIRLAIKLAKGKGDIIAIGHPHPGTVEALSGMKDELMRSGVELVYVSALVR